jgi:hypothetical protein
MRLFIHAALASLGLILSGGCATIMTGAGPNQTVKVSSTPRGARVYVDGEYRGTTPVGVAMTRSDRHLVRLELDGYSAAERSLAPGYNPWHLGNIVLGGLVGASVDLLDGSFLWLGGPVNQKLVRVPVPGAMTAAASAAPPPGAGSYRQDGATKRIDTVPLRADNYRARGTGGAKSQSPPRGTAAGGDTTTRLPPRRLAGPPKPTL